MNHVLAFRPGVSAASLSCKLVKPVFYQSLAFGWSVANTLSLMWMIYLKNAREQDLRGVRPGVPFQRWGLLSHMVLWSWNERRQCLVISIKKSLSVCFPSNCLQMNLSYKSSKHIVVNKLIYHRFIKHRPSVKYCSEQTKYFCRSLFFFA